MNFLSPNDNPVNNSSSDSSDGDFGGNRKHTTGVQRKQHDYTKVVGGNCNTKVNPVDKTTRDIDEMTDPSIRKREFSRRAETNNHADLNKEHFHEADSGNRPSEDTDGTTVPDGKHRRSKNKNHFGEGQYEGEIS